MTPCWPGADVDHMRTAIRNRGRNTTSSEPFVNAVYEAAQYIDGSDPHVTIIHYKPGEARGFPVLRAGNIVTPGEMVPRHFPTVLAKGDATFKNGSRRLELAERIFSDSAPLAARIIVNRVWGWHFGKPLVATTSDFGVQGEKPSHPELLDCFLPAKHQGTPFDSGQSEPEKMIPDLRNKWLDNDRQRKQLDAMQALNRAHAKSFGADEFLDGRIQSMESAFRLQTAATDAFDIRKEPESIREEHGANNAGNSCLLARRLVERGVRYVHVAIGNWDDHKDLPRNYAKNCPSMDRAAATLIRDLKRRGLLDDTSVVWGGEFGRTPVSGSGTGRDHNPYGYTMWLAGGGFKPGIAYGATDDFGFKAVENTRWAWTIRNSPTATPAAISA